MLSTTHKLNKAVDVFFIGQESLKHLLFTDDHGTWFRTFSDISAVKATFNHSAQAFDAHTGSSKPENLTLRTGSAQDDYIKAI
ncbi:hypothetical protein PsorP6_015298 [Peronosclerospora sorghi]|uniref:Uncharacterized protein n=1 Tax=Peronosclerospora sorghi TaxID=230839 RepID=A0ACC0VT74_9STRA|nr:hypothetical protein PsorP6_015298 [Peronosclerospora sorghi]